MSARVQSPGMELRFTRSRQAVGFWLAAAVCAMAAISLLVISLQRHENPRLPHSAWSLPPAVAAWFLSRMAWRLTRHAYLILTPLGIEIFPFFRPAAGMQLVAWQEVAGIESDPALTRLTLHHNAEKTSGIHLSLRPIRVDRRHLLVDALARRIAQTTDGDQ